MKTAEVKDETEQRPTSKSKVPNKKLDMKDFMSKSAERISCHATGKPIIASKFGAT